VSPKPPERVKAAEEQAAIQYKSEIGCRKAATEAIYRHQKQYIQCTERSSNSAAAA
jgi:hypothetical protein